MILVCVCVRILSLHIRELTTGLADGMCKMIPAALDLGHFSHSWIQIQGLLQSHQVFKNTVCNSWCHLMVPHTRCIQIFGRWELYLNNIHSVEFSHCLCYWDINTVPCSFKTVSISGIHKECVARWYTSWVHLYLTSPHCELWQRLLCVKLQPALTPHFLMFQLCGMSRLFLLLLTFRLCE